MNKKHLVILIIFVLAGALIKTRYDQFRFKNSRLIVILDKQKKTERYKLGDLTKILRNDGSEYDLKVVYYFTIYYPEENRNVTIRGNYWAFEQLTLGHLYRDFYDGTSKDLGIYNANA